MILGLFLNLMCKCRKSESMRMIFENLGPFLNFGPFLKKFGTFLIFNPFKQGKKI